MLCRIFRAGRKLNAFYTLLVKEGELPNNGVEVDSADTDKDKLTVDVEDSRNRIEVSYGFTKSNNYFFSYLLRTVM